MGGGTSSYREVEEADVIVLWGSNARAAHPIFFHHLLRGVSNGARMWTVDPRRTDSARFADTWLGINVGTDIALANGLAREIIHAGLENQEFIDNATSDYGDFAAHLEPWTLGRTSEVTGVPAEAISDLGRRAGTFQASLEDLSSLTRMMDSVQEELGDPGILINNAGIASRGKTVAETETEEVDRLMRVHAFAPHELCKLILPGMRAHERGDVIMVSS